VELWVWFVFRQIVLPPQAEQILHGLAWTVVALSLVLIGMRLSQLNSWHSLPRAATSLGIKMLIVPYYRQQLIAVSLTGFQLVIVLQMAMPQLLQH